MSRREKRGYGGGRRRNRTRLVVVNQGMRWHPRTASALAQFGAVAAEAGTLLVSTLGVAMSTLLFPAMRTSLLEQRIQETEEFGRAIGAPEGLIAGVIGQTLELAASTPDETDWAIARTNITALAAMTNTGRTRA